MQASTHKTIVRGACGCAAAGAVLMVVVWILAINYARSPRAGDEVPRAAVAALDTLARAGWPATTRPAPSIAFGDTFPAGARARQRWLQAGRHAAVDSFLALRTSVARAGKVSEVAIRCSVACSRRAGCCDSWRATPLSSIRSQRGRSIPCCRCRCAMIATAPSGWAGWTTDRSCWAVSPRGATASWPGWRIRCRGRFSPRCKARGFASPGWVQRLSFAAAYDDITAPLVAP